MPSYRYTAVDQNGKEKKGRIDADSEQDATTQLKEKGLFPTEISEAKQGKSGKGQQGQKKAGGGGGGAITLGTPKLKAKALTEVTRQLATLLDAGLPLVRALRTLERQAQKDPIRRQILGDLATTVEGGGTFSDALANHPKSFSKLYVNMVRAGEASGAMETVLNRLAEFLEKAQRLASRIKGAMVYPAVVLTVALGITSGLMIFIVPKFAQIFEDMLPGESLPALTNFVLGVSEVMQAKMHFVLIGIAVLVVLFKLLRKTKYGALAMDFILLKIPIIKDVVLKSIVSRFCRTLGTLMQSGVAVLQALQIVRDTAGNQIVANAIQTVHDAVKEGEGISGPLESTKVFPGMVVSMMQVGEETGALPDMLNKIADTYEEEVDNAVDGMTSMIEPVMIVFMAGIIGTIVIALFMPLIKLMNQLGG